MNEILLKSQAYVTMINEILLQLQAYRNMSVVMHEILLMT